ncbi:MAG: hypothetical protein NTV86_03935 [Planctomycetota bacterium]|nr:hypothetical protein [Planctomycetota bacterium]
MTYDHTQKSPLYLILLLPAVVVMVSVVVAPAPPPVFALLMVVEASLIVAAFSFMHLRVRDQGDYLAVRFGPLPIFRRRIPYVQITGAEAWRSSFLDGWGVHWMAGRGWIYNLWGFDCVVVHLGAKTFRIGTDDVDGLVGFLKAKVEGCRHDER